MLELKQSAIAGSLESSDVQITLEPNPGGGREIQVQSVVKMQFGDSILALVGQVLDAFGVRDARVSLNDKGAIDAVLTARLQTAICRAAGVRYDWAKEAPHGH